MHRSKLVLSLLATFALALSASQSYADALTTLASFNNVNGGYSYGGVTLSGSTLYGENQVGGAYGDGVVFSVPVTGGTVTDVASFNDTDGYRPEGNVTIIGSTIYGMTTGGGSGGFGSNSGNGAIFSVPATGGTPTDLYGFPLYGNGGASPWGSLTLSANGSTFYGMTSGGGANGDGTVFSIPVSGGTPTVLASFNGTDGKYAYGDVTLVGSTLYGMTSTGGAHNDGVIFSIPVAGGTPTVLASFNGTDGANPNGDLTLSGSTFYGLTSGGGLTGGGTIFNISVSGGNPNTLYSFTGPTGSGPLGSLTLSADGSTLYGMSPIGGAYNDGQIFSIPVAGGTPTVLHSFDGIDGRVPLNSLTLSGSTLYGVTAEGGANNDGSVFALNLVPEPSSVVLLGMGAIGFGAIALRRKMQKQAA
jgi:uncharacterized repeat protein (TIGR03803 family)